MTTEIDLKLFLNKIDALINTLHYVKIDLSLSPKKEHIVTCIKYQGLNQMRKEFIVKLVNSITKYIYSNERRERLLQELMEAENMDESDANTEIFQ